MQLFDTHTHLLDSRFDADRNALARDLPRRGVVHLLEACSFAEEAPSALALCEQHGYIVAALGTHPHEAARMTLAHMELLERLLAHRSAVAVGEIGLDYHYDFSPRETQREWFDAQLALANRLKKPVVLHVREAFEDAMALLHTHRNGLTGVMHCFSGSLETAKACLDLGLYIAFGGALTFRNAKRAVEVAAYVPQDRMLIETDCPYMTPEPHRGERNDPSLVRLVCERMAEIRGISPEEMAAITLQNGKELFGIE